MQLILEIVNWYRDTRICLLYNIVVWSLNSGEKNIHILFFKSHSDHNNNNNNNNNNNALLALTTKRHIYMASDKLQ